MKQALAAYEYLITKLGVPTSKIVIGAFCEGLSIFGLNLLT